MSSRFGTNTSFCEWSCVPCGILTLPNGFDFNCQRASFCCTRQYVSAKDLRIAEYAKDCAYRINYHGFTKHMSIRQFLRLISEVIKGSYRHRRLKALRPASKRINSTAKDGFCLLLGSKTEKMVDLFLFLCLKLLQLQKAISYHVF